MSQTVTIKATGAYQYNKRTASPVSSNAVDIGTQASASSSNAHAGSFFFDLSPYSDKQITSASFYFYCDYIYNNTVTNSIGVGICYNNIASEVYQAGENAADFIAIKNSTGGKTVTLSSGVVQQLQGQNSIYICLAEQGRSGNLDSRKQLKSGLNTSYTPSLIIEYEEYSACTPPTSFVNLGIIKPNSSATLSWTGATAGTGLTIASYQIQYKIDSGEWNDLGSSLTETKTITTITDTYRGSVVSFRLKSIASVPGYDSSWSSTFTGYQINRLPLVPTLSESSKTISSTAASVQVTASSSDPDQGQTITYYYNDGNTEYTGQTATINPTIGSSLTYTFYCKDSLGEQGPSISITITRNAPPSFTNSSLSNLNKFNALGNDGVISYSLGWMNLAEGSVTANKNTTINFYLIFEYSNNDGTLADATGTLIGTSSINAATPFSYSYSIEDKISNYDYNYNVKWKIRIQLNDGLDTSASVYLPSNGNFYKIPHAPSTLNYYNQWENSNISGSISGHFYKKIRIKFYNDESCDSYSVSSSNGSASINSSYLESSNTIRVLDILLNSEPIFGTNYTFTITCSTNKLNKQFSQQLFSVKAPLMSNFIYGSSTEIKPYTCNDIHCVAAWPFGTEIDLVNGLAAYEINSINEIKVVNSKNTYNFAKTVKNNTVQKSNDNILFDIDENDVYPFNGELGISNYVGTYNYSVKYTITNVYGVTYESSFIERILNFNETPLNIVNGTLQWKQNIIGSSYANFPNNAKLQDGVSLKFLFSFSYYTPETLTYSLELSKDGGTNFNIVSSIAETLSVAGSHDNPILKSNAELEFLVSEDITTTQSYLWRVQINCANGNTYGNNIIIPIAKHCAPTDLILTSADINENSSIVTITYSGSVSDYGYDASVGSINKYINIIGDNSTEENKTISTLSGETSSLSETWEAASIRFKIVTTVSSLYSNTKTFYSNIIRVFRTTPTIAYRKNQLGINTKTINNDTLIKIRPISTYRKIIVGSTVLSIDETTYEITTSGGSWT